MEYGEKNGVVGKVPEFGAIFMSNISTKKECFRRKLFGLPSAMADFAKQVKTGMVLFLFEFERRELFGVFQATSDGAINIVPNAFSLSGGFPAQVRVASIWFCSPLSEHEFRDAIKENYFSSKKFNFGLSEDQVHRLLCLFSSRKLKEGASQRQLAREATLPFGEDRGQTDDDTTSDIVEYEPNVGNYPMHHITSKFREESLDKVKRVGHNRFSRCDMAESEDKVDYDLGRDVLSDDCAGVSWGKRRMDDHNVREKDLFEYGATQHILRNEHNRDSLGEGRIVADDGWFLNNDRIIEHDMNNATRPVISPNHLENSFNEVRRVDVDSSAFRRVSMSVENEHKIGKRGTSESRFFLNDRLENELHGVSTGDYVCTRSSDSRPYLVNDRAENEITLDNSFGSVISTDYSRYTLGEDRLIANDDRFRKNKEDFGNFYSGKPTETEYSSPLNGLKKMQIFDQSYQTSHDEIVTPLNGLEKMPIFDRSYQTSHDDIVTRTVPYDPEAPDIFRREPLPVSPYIELNYRSPSKIESTPHHSEFESLSRCLDFHPGHGNVVPLPKILPQIQKISCGSTPIHINPSFVTSNMGNSLFAFDNCYPVESHQNHETVGPKNNEALTRKESYSPDAGGSSLSRFESDDMGYQRSGTLHRDNKNNRTSVFSRLTLAPKASIQENNNRMQVVHNRYSADVSVDDVMNLFRQSQNRRIMTKKYNPSVRRLDNDENVRVKDFFAIHDTIKYEQSRIKTVNDDADAKMEIDVKQIIEKSGEPLLEETRLVDFKRRSSIKRDLNDTTTKGSVGNVESEGQKSADSTEELVGKPRKRRKLVRPVFSKKDPMNESFSGEGTLNLTSSSHNDT